MHTDRRKEAHTPTRTHRNTRTRKANRASFLSVPLADEKRLPGSVPSQHGQISHSRWPLDVFYLWTEFYGCYNKQCGTCLLLLAVTPEVPLSYPLHGDG